MNKSHTHETPDCTAGALWGSHPLPHDQSVIEPQATESGDACKSRQLIKSEQYNHIPDFSELDCKSMFKLPQDSPEDLLDLGPLDHNAENLKRYRACRTWSFKQHIENLPRNGVGELHDAIYRAALSGLAEGITPLNLHFLIRDGAISKGRLAGRANVEVRDALINAHRWLGGKNPGSDKTPSISKKIDKVDWGMVRGVAFSDYDLNTLSLSSGALPGTAEDVFRKLYHPHDLICLAVDLSNAQTKKLDDWLGGGKLSHNYMVANPMRSLSGITLRGKQSPRSKDNAGECRWIVVEFDFRKDNEADARLIAELAENGKCVLDLGAALHCHLQTFLPLAMVVFSGNTSLHGWYDARAITVGEADKFREYAKTLKADSATFGPCQMVRVPWGFHKNGNQQCLCYFNEDVVNAN